jgi:hypothetical protein
LGLFAEHRPSTTRTVALLIRFLLATNTPELRTRQTARRATEQSLHGVMVQDSLIERRRTRLQAMLNNAVKLRELKSFGRSFLAAIPNQSGKAPLLRCLKKLHQNQPTQRHSLRT